MVFSDGQRGWLEGRCLVSGTKLALVIETRVSFRATAGDAMSPQPPNGSTGSIASSDVK